MKIYICTNKFQKLAAKVSAYSFAKYGFNDIEILENGEQFVITGGVPMGIAGTTNYLSVQVYKS